MAALNLGNLSFSANISSKTHFVSGSTPQLVSFATTPKKPTRQKFSFRVMGCSASSSQKPDNIQGTPGTGEELDVDFVLLQVLGCGISLIECPLNDILRRNCQFVRYDAVFVNGGKLQNLNFWKYGTNLYGFKFEFLAGKVDYTSIGDEEWKKRLTGEQFYITRKKGTERAFTGEYWNTKTPGTYHCICCDMPLFESSTKFDSGTGWPSYYQPIGNNVKSKLDLSIIIMPRQEVLCGACDAHLGHVFDDGPPPTGKRYCINSASLKLKPN